MTSLIRRVVVAIAIGLGLVAAGALGYAQGQRPVKPVFPPSVDAQAAEAQPVFSGDDIGFRMESRRGGTPVGKLVVKVDGKWVEVEFSTGLKRMTTTR